MIQTVAIFTKTGAIQVELPAPDEILMSGIKWGAVDAFPTPAYWQCQVVSRRLIGRPSQYKLGRTLVEEVAACLLGGHGIPAPIGIAAYEMLRKRGAFSEATPSEQQLMSWLREPLQIGKRQVRYRFAAQKARYLAAALPSAQSAPEFETGKQLRDWLRQLSGIGLKTASWIARNWMDADDVAILDIHIMRVGQVLGLFPANFTVERNYLELEALFLQFSQALDVRASELDAVMWHEMASSPVTARAIIDHLKGPSVVAGRQHRKKESVEAQLSLV